MLRNKKMCYEILNAINERGHSDDRIEKGLGLGTYPESDLLTNYEFRVCFNLLLRDGYIEKRNDFNSNLSPFVFISLKGLRYLEVYDLCEKMRKIATTPFEEMICDVVSCLI